MGEGNDAERRQRWKDNAARVSLMKLLDEVDSFQMKLSADQATATTISSERHRSTSSNDRQAAPASAQPVADPFEQTLRRIQWSSATIQRRSTMKTK
jgi:hypothetical protein